MRRFVPIFVLFSLLIGPVWSQNPVTHPKRAPFQLAPDLTASDYVPNIVVMRVKEQYRPYCSPNAISIPGLEKYFEELGQGKLQRSFPHTPPPSEPTDELGRKMVDLTLVYELQYTENLPIETAVNSLLNTGVFEYVEPLYIYQSLYDPSDPDTAAQYYLSLLRARDAWDITKGDTNVVISVVDNGTSFTHPDLATEYAYNTGDPIDGIDNDGDGYVDNYRGWDMGGDYWLSPGDNDPTWAGNQPGVDHGIIVAGPAVAATDNGSNIASIGFNCRLLPVKVTIDLSILIYRGYQGLVYAADHGADIINLSWGGTARSRMGEDAVNYAVINKGKLVVVAGGNTPADLRFIPATYHRAIGVGGSGPNDAFWYTNSGSGTTYNYLLDITAPSESITSIRLNAGTFAATGTSMGAPIVAGSAGLVKANSPSLTNEQVGQQVRVTAFQGIYGMNSGFYAEKMGRGRVDTYAALTDVSPSVRVLDYNLNDPDDGVVAGGDTVDLELRLVNFLAPVNDLQVTASVPNVSANNFQIVHGDIGLGTMNTMDTASLRLAPFRIRVAPGTPAGYVGYIRIGYSGNGYSDYEYLRVQTDDDYINLDENRIEISFTGSGRWGYTTTGQGRGWVVDGESGLMNDAGFAVGISPTQVVDNFENQNGTFNGHFQNLTPIERRSPGIYADAESNTVYNDQNAGSNAVGIEVEQNNYQFELAPDDNYIIQEYTLHNPSATDTIKGAYAGMYFDIDGYWFTNNVSQYDSASRCIYNFTETWTNLWNMGVALLTPDSLHGYASDVGNFGFTAAEKWNALTSPPSAANVSFVDVVQFASAGPFDIAPGSSHTVAFAIVAADSIPHLRNSVQRAHDKYWCVIRGGMAPQVDLGQDMLLCEGDTMLTLDAGSGYSSYLWSNGSPAATMDIDSSGTYWVKVTDANGCEDYDQIQVTIGDGIDGGFTCAPANFFVGDTISFSDTTAVAVEWGWNFGDGSINCPIYPNVNHAYNAPGTYEVQLYVSNGVCRDTIRKTLMVDTIVGIALDQLASSLVLAPNPAAHTVRYSFSNPTQGQYQLTAWNQLGQMVREEKGEKWNQEQNGVLEVDQLPRGMYWVRMEIGEVRVARKLILN